MRVTALIGALLLAATALAATRPDELTPERRQELEKKALELTQEAIRRYGAGEYVKAQELGGEALQICRTLYPREQFPRGHRNLANGLNNLAGLHQAVGDYGKAEPLFKEALEMYRALYPREAYPQGHTDLAIGINNLGVLYHSAGEYGQAEPLFNEALAMRRALYPSEKYPRGHLEIASSLGNLASLYLNAGEYGQAEPLFKEALDMKRALYPREQFPRGHRELATSVLNLASLQEAAGEYGRAEPLLKEALEMYRALYPKEQFPRGHPELAKSINNVAALHQAAGEYGKAGTLYQEALAMRRALYPREKYPRGHPELARGINNLASLHHAAGEYGKAEALFKEALAMRRALFPREQFPQGHPDLAQSINNLAALYQGAGEHSQAESLFKEALEMDRALFPREKYPRGHPELARCVSSLAWLHHEAGEYGQAEPFYREALAMRRALFPSDQYPRGHRDIAQSLNNLAEMHHSAGEYGKAEALFKEALAMRRALFPRERFPQGHPHLALSLSSLANLYQAVGEYGRAETLLKEALEMGRGLLLRYAELAAEAECLNYLETQPLTRDALLSATRRPSPSAGVYDVLWDGRAVITRLMEARHRDLMASRDSDTRDLADQLRLARLTLGRRLLQPLPDPEKQRAAVQKLTDLKEGLEKGIAQKLRLAGPQPLTTPPPQRLTDRLPEGTAFVDFYRYTRLDQDPHVKGRKGEKWTACYVAFVVRPGRPVARVELKEAAPVEQAWAEWRRALTAARPDEKAERQAAAALAKLVWEPLREELPAELKTVYLTPDGDLHQVPWGALPGRKPETVLLDEHAVCLVPHGPFLLGRLVDERRAAPAGTLLAVGGVDYDGPAEALAAQRGGVALREAAVGTQRVRWPALAGTERERQQVAALARQAAKLDVVERSGKGAGTEQLQRDLPAARYAHVATHGFFADPQFRSALQLDPKLFERISQDRRAGARSPLALSGLVLAGANRNGGEMADDRGIITAEGLIGLRLEGLELAVLSACETGLGAWGGGEGVYGLQRAFHVAGCRDVVASLWKVDDGATQALMALFYRNLWEKKLDPAEALRQAQLTLYRHPEAVQVAQKRGVDFTEGDLPKVEEKPAEKPTRSPTAHWAAFTFSGVRPAATGR